MGTKEGLLLQRGLASRSYEAAALVSREFPAFPPAGYAPPVAARSSGRFHKIPELEEGTRARQIGGSAELTLNTSQAPQVKRV